MSVFRRKWEFLLLCCATYMCAYLCRVNLSSALGKMEIALGASSAALGLLGTAYFFVYACFQLISGFSGDRLRPDRMIAIGLVGIAATNIGISLSTEYSAIMALWCFNGVFQSMLWGPMSRLLAGRFEPGERVTVSTFLSLSMPCGYILSWSVLAPVLAESPWPFNFRVPGAILLIPMALWLILTLTDKNGHSVQTASAEKPTFAALLRTVREERLWLVCIGCLANVMLKESFTIWAPMILTKLLGVNARQSALYLILFPVCNAAFIAAMGKLIRRTHAPLKTPLRVAFSMMALCAVLLMLGVSNKILAVALMAMISGFGYAANSVFLGMLPMSYAEKNMTSTLVGLFDFSAYIGAGVAAYGLGLLITGSDLKPIATVWLIAAIAAVAALTFARGSLARKREA